MNNLCYAACIDATPSKIYVRNSKMITGGQSELVSYILVTVTERILLTLYKQLLKQFIMDHLMEGALVMDLNFSVGN